MRSRPLRPSIGADSPVRGPPDAGKAGPEGTRRREARAGSAGSGAASKAARSGKRRDRGLLRWHRWRLTDSAAQSGARGPAPRRGTGCPEAMAATPWRGRRSDCAQAHQHRGHLPASDQDRGDPRHRCHAACDHDHREKAVHPGTRGLILNRHCLDVSHNSPSNQRTESMPQAPFPRRSARAAGRSGI